VSTVVLQYCGIGLNKPVLRRPNTGEVIDSIDVDIRTKEGDFCDLKIGPNNLKEARS